MDFNKICSDHKNSSELIYNGRAVVVSRNRNLTASACVAGLCAAAAFHLNDRPRLVPSSTALHSHRSLSSSLLTFPLLPACLTPAPAHSTISQPLFKSANQSTHLTVSHFDPDEPTSGHPRLLCSSWRCPRRDRARSTTAVKAQADHIRFRTNSSCLDRRR